MSCAKKGLESAWLNYEAGHCHMEEREFDSATSCAEKALENANDANDNGWKLNARVLLAQIQSKCLYTRYNPEKHTTTWHV